MATSGSASGRQILVLETIYTKFRTYSTMDKSILDDTSSFNKSHSSQPHALSKNTQPKPISQEMTNALKAIEGLNLMIEIRGACIWIFGAGASYEAVLRAANFQWSYLRCCWYLCSKSNKPQNDKPRSDYQPWGMSKICTRYGSQLLRV